MRKSLILIFIASLVACASCTGNLAYDHYEHTPIAGWDKVDTLSFAIPAMKEPGRYATTLGLRITNGFPYQRLTLIVEQTVFHKSQTSKLKAQSFTDTISCTLFDRNGTTRGRGIGYYQYQFRVSERNLNAGDSLHITVRHNMRREIMPGIADVGISISQ